MKKLIFLLIFFMFSATLIVEAKTESFTVKANERVIITPIGRSEMFKEDTKTVIPLFRIHTGNIDIPRVANKKHGMKADIYTPLHSDQWKLTIVRRGRPSRHLQLSTRNLPFPMGYLSEKELGYIQYFLIYPNKSLNVYLKPIGPDEVKMIFKKLANVINGTLSK